MVHMIRISRAFIRKITSLCTAAALLTAFPVSTSAASMSMPLPAPKVVFHIPQTAQPTKIPVIPEDPNSRENILKLVNPIEIDAVTKTKADMYADPINRKFVTSVASETKVKLLRDKGEVHALVRLDDGKTGWIKYSSLNISIDKYIIKEDLAEQQKNLFVNYKEYASDTKYLIWVNLERQRVNVFEGSKGNWKLLKSMVCSSGKNTTPTINGEFKYYQLQKRINFDDYYVVDFMRYYDSFAIHSVPFTFDNKLYDDTLGTPNSHGCIRVSPEDIKWLSKTIPFNTKIIVL